MLWAGKKKIPQVTEEEVEGQVDWEKVDKPANNSDYCLL